MSERATKLRNLHELVSEHLAEIGTYFKPGYKLTLLARNPDVPDGSQDMFCGDDSAGEAVAAILRLDDVGEVIA